MAAKKTKTEKIEREYTIPLREKCRSVAIYKKTPKAIKTVKEFLAKHMKVENRDLKKVKLDRFVNEAIWARGIKKPLNKIKVKVTKEDGIVTAELAEVSKKFKDKKAREEKRSALGNSNVKNKVVPKEKAKDAPEKKTEDKKGEEDKDKDGVKDSVEIAEKEKSNEETKEKEVKADSKEIKSEKAVKNKTSKAKENKVGSA